MRGTALVLDPSRRCLGPAVSKRRLKCASVFRKGGEVRIFSQFRIHLDIREKEEPYKWLRIVCTSTR